ncbi:uncharacterized protein LOC121862088 [Homarus americanus]|uniref:uncharacterized protein LOC121862088 n=1 Tax=Homarus americanus TaxID=6706 RepID=UPI001C4884B8|nr:uncharacterized protein LOC121862088 [Homarus americanus]
MWQNWNTKYIVKLGIILLGTVVFVVVSLYSHEAVRSDSDPTPAVSMETVSRPTCHALFTISDVPLHTPEFQQYFGGNVTNSESPGGERSKLPGSHVTRIEETVLRVRLLLKKRSSSSGATTEDYRKLAELLPSLLSFSEDHAAREEEAGANRIPKLVSTSRITATGGVLPYVPCAIASYHDPASITTCFRKRLSISDSLWLFFLGDSKIRNIFYEFLRRTDQDYYYQLKLPNGTEPLRELLKTPTKIHDDIEATTSLFPRLRITFKYRKFNDIVPSMIRKSNEVKLLTSWATGKATPPHLLLIGYTPWMMQRMRTQYPHDLLGDLMEVHRIVMPLLYQISQRTRLLVVPQSRYRPHAQQGLLDTMALANGDPVNDWSEMMFLQYYRLHHRDTRDDHHDTTDDYQDTTDDHHDNRDDHHIHDHVFDYTSGYNHTQNDVKNRTYDDHSRVYLRDDTKGDHHDTRGDHIRDIYDNHLPRNTPPPSLSRPVPNRNNKTAQLPLLRSGNNVVPSGVKGDHLAIYRTKRDHLVLAGTHEEPWWWDTSLPLNLAAVKDCETLYRRGLEDVDVYKGEHLLCKDQVHAARATLGDMATMMYNLLCNSVLGAHSSFCCH